MTNLLAIALTSTNCLCPLPPPGYYCYQDAPARATNVVQFRMVAHEGYLEIIHPATTNREYEVQFKRSLADTQWLAYARLVLTNEAILTTHVPMPCPREFIRVRWGPVQN